MRAWAHMQINPKFRGLRYRGKSLGLKELLFAILRVSSGRQVRAFLLCQHSPSGPPETVRAEFCLRLRVLERRVLVVESDPRVALWDLTAINIRMRLNLA